MITDARTAERWETLERAVFVWLACWISSAYLLSGTPVSGEMRDWLTRLDGRGFLLFYAGSACIMHWKRGPRDTVRSVAYACVLCLFARTAVSIALVHTPDGVHRTAAFLLIGTASGMIAAWLCRTPQRAIEMMVALVGIEAILAIVRYLGGQDSFYSGDTLRAGGTYGEPSVLYRIIAPCLPLAVALVVQNRTRYARAIWLGFVGVIGLALLFAMYREGVLAAFVSVVLLLHLVRTPRKYMVLVWLACITLSVGVCAMRVRDSRDRLSSARSVRSRPVLWREGWDVFVKHPLFGVGQGKLALPAFARDHGKIVPISMQGPQNELLFVLAEDGVCGGAVLLAFTVSTLVLLLRKRDAISLGLATAWTTIALCGLTDTVYGVGEWTYGPITCVVGVLLGATLMTSDAQDSSAIEKSGVR